MAAGNIGGSIREYIANISSCPFGACMPLPEKYVVRKTGEFYDNMYIQPIYKTRGKAENMGMAGRCTSMMTENDAQEKRACFDMIG